VGVSPVIDCVAAVGLHSVSTAFTEAEIQTQNSARDADFTLFI